MIHHPLADGTGMGSLRYYRFPAVALVVSNIQAWEGAIAVSSQSESDEFVCSNRFLPYVPKRRDEADVQYLRHYFLTDEGLADLRRASPGTQVRNRTLGKTLFEETVVPLPGIDEQRCIAARLHQVDSLAASAKTAVAMRSHVLNAIEDGSWQGVRVRIGSLVSRVSRPEAVKHDCAYRLQGVRWYGGGMFTREIKAGDSLAARTVFRVDSGDLVYNRLFAWKQSFALADSSDGVASNEFPTFLIQGERVIPRVFLALLLGRDFTRQVNDVSTGSTPTSRNRLKEQDFLRLEVTLPVMSEQRHIAQLLATVDSASALSRQQTRLATALLPAARNEIFNAMR